MSEWFTDKVVFVRHNGMSALFQHTEDPEDGEFWIPLSKIDADVDWNDLNRGDVIQISIPLWLAEKEGLC